MQIPEISSIIRTIFFFTEKKKTFFLGYRFLYTNYVFRILYPRREKIAASLLAWNDPAVTCVTRHRKITPILF